MISLRTVFCKLIAYCFFVKTVVFFSKMCYNKQKYNSIHMGYLWFGGFIMADSKRYVSLAQENGSVLISEEVVAAIAANAIKEVEGVIGMTAKPGSDIAGVLGKRNWNKGIRVLISDRNTLALYCNIVIAFGSNIMTVSNAVQKAVSNAVESVTGVKVRMVHVNVCEIVRQ